MFEKGPYGHERNHLNPAINYAKIELREVVFHWLEKNYQIKIIFDSKGMI